MREKITSERSHGEPVEPYVGKRLYALSVDSLRMIPLKKYVMLNLFQHPTDMCLQCRLATCL